MNKFLETHTLSGLNHEEIKNLNRPITNKDIEVIIKKLTTNKKLGTDAFTGELYQTLKELTLKLFQKKLKRKECFLTLRSQYYPVSKLDKDTRRKEN